MRRFNVRVYGILIQDKKILVSDEYIKGNRITKFPGGGLEFGEGTIECIVREFKEELDTPIQVLRHFYTTDFFVNSAFDINSQVISIYYLVEPLNHFHPLTQATPHNYKIAEGAQAFRWIDQDKISDNDFTLIIDKKVGEMLSKLNPE